ncbi:MAG: HlyD family type I secretion periplasmic adaptor subunit [Pseudomonadota bacterium]
MTELSPDPSGLTAKGPVRIGIATIVLLGLSVAGWSLGTEISGAIIGKGRIELKTTSHVVSHEHGGTVISSVARKGMRVSRGDILAQLNPVALDAQIAAAKQTLIEGYARASRLAAVMADQPVLKPLTDPDRLPGLAPMLAQEADILKQVRADMDRIVRLETARLQQTEAQIAGFDAELMALGREGALLRADLQKKRELAARGVITKASFLDLERENHRLDGETARLTASRDELRARAIELRLQIESIAPNERRAARETLETLRQTLTENEARLATLRVQRDASDVVAPISGTILDVSVTGPGYVVSAGGPVATIVPDTAAMRAVIKIGTEDVDQVYPSQPTNLQFQSFNARALPLVQAEVETISADAVYDEVLRRWFYDVFVVFSQSDLEPLGDVRVMNGMEVTAFIQTTPQRPLDYLVAPVAAYFERAFRDR